MHWLLLSFTWTFFATSAPEQRAKPPHIVTWTTETEHDFGEIRQGSTARFVFTFKNTSNESIVLQTVRTTCGCTAAEWTEEPLASGASGAVNIEFDADRSGAFRKKITVFFDKQRKPEVLWVRGEVI